MVSRDDVRWLTSPQQRSWRAYLIGTELLHQQLDRELRDEHEISLSEYEILVRLSETPQRRMRMALLADSISHSRSRVTHTVSRMEKEGLVLRQACAEDGRGVEAMMTEAGQLRLDAAAPTHVRGVRAHLVDVADAGDFEALGRVFDEVSDRLLRDKPASADIR